MRELQDVFAEISFDDFDARRLQRIVERALLAYHRFRFRGLAHAVARREFAHNAIGFLGGLRPVHHRAARRGIFFELLEIDVEVGERAIADRGGRAANVFEVVELGDAVSTPLDEIALEFPERGLQLHIGELLAGARLEIHGRNLHKNPIYRQVGKPKQRTD